MSDDVGEISAAGLGSLSEAIPADEPQAPHEPSGGRAPVLATVEWDDQGAIAVRPTDEWLHVREPAALVSEVFTLATEHFGHAAAGSTWRAGLSIRNVGLDHLREFTALLREARAEQESSDPIQSQQVQSSHGSSRWVGGHVIDLTVDLDWLRDAMQQEISDEFVALLTPPAVELAPPSPARDRMAHFLQEAAQ